MQTLLDVERILEDVRADRTEQALFQLVEHLQINNFFFLQLVR